MRAAQEQQAAQEVAKEAAIEDEEAEWEAEAAAEKGEVAEVVVQGAATEGGPSKACAASWCSLSSLRIEPVFTDHTFEEVPLLKLIGVDTAMQDSARRTTALPA